MLRINCLLLLVICGLPSFAKSIKVTSTNYKAAVDVFQPKAKRDNKSIVFITLHGKVGGRRHSGNRTLARRLKKKGYWVYAPEMPWAGYTATLTDAFLHIDELVKIASKSGKKVVIVGHSMGATIAFLYAAAHKPAKEVAAIIMQAPGHVLHSSHFIQEATAIDVQTARKMKKQGLGKEKKRFHDLNQGKRFSVTVGAEIYLSYFDPAIFPSIHDVVKKINIPVMWIDGKNDMMSVRMNYESIFNNIKKHKRNKYITVRGGHVSMMSATINPIIEWVEQLVDE